jgi:membrane protein
LDFFKIIWRLIKDTVDEWFEDKAARLAAALAYYAIFSLAPLLIIILAITGMIIDPAKVETYITQQAQGLVGPEGAGIIRSIAENASQPSSSVPGAIVGFGILIFGATGFFVQLQDALNMIWEVQPDPGRGFMNLLWARFLSFLMILGIGFLLLVSLLVSTGLAALTQYLTGIIPFDIGLSRIVELVVSFVVITFLFGAIFKVLPDVEIEWRDVWVGAAVTALLFVVGKYLISLYLGTKSFSSTYGAAGSIMVLLLWVYYSAQILLFGAEFTQVYARRFGSRLAPAEGAVRVISNLELGGSSQTDDKADQPKSARAESN